MATTLATPSTLPLELGGISEERRQQLELRRQREMARQQESRAGTGNFRWSPVAMIPAHLCVLIFLIFLLEKLEGSIDWPWAAVLSPLWITDAVFIVIKSKELRIILRTTVHVPSEAYALFPPLGGIIDHLGVAAAKVTLAYRLESKVDWSLLLLFTPMWACVVLSGTLRCITPPHPQVMGDQVYFHRAGAFFTGLFHLVARGAQPMLIVLKVDGQVSGPWSSVFIPLWIFTGVFALGGSALCFCAPMVSRGVIPEIRPVLIKGMLLCSVGTFSLTFCALLFLVFLTLELDNNEDFSPRTILAPLIALYALILVFVPLLLLVTRHYVRTMHEAEQIFRQANDPNGGGMNASEAASAFDDAEAGRGGTGGARGVGMPGGSPDLRAGVDDGGGAAGGGRRRRRRRGDGVGGPGEAPTILMRESSTLFRRASASLCRRLGEADGSLLGADFTGFELADWSLRNGCSRSRDPGGDGDEGVGDEGERAPQRSSRSFHGLQDFLPQAREAVSRGGQRFSAVVRGTSNRKDHDRFSIPAGRQRAGAEKESSPLQREREGNEPAAKGGPEDDRHDRLLLPVDSGTHSVTDSYDLNSFGSYIDSDEDNHEVGLSIDGDEEDEDRDGALDAMSHHPPSTLGGAATAAAATAATLPQPPQLPPPEILLGFGSAHGAAAFSLHGGGGGGSGHGLGRSRHRWSAEPDTGRRRRVAASTTAAAGGSLHGGGVGAGGMPRRLSWPCGMSAPAAPPSSAIAGVGLEGGLGGGAAVLASRFIEAGAPTVAAGSCGTGLLLAAPQREQPVCYICCERRADAVVMECGHGGLCFACATQLADTPPHQCPVCRKPIQEVLMLQKVQGFCRVLPVPGGGGGSSGIGVGRKAAGGKPAAASARGGGWAGGDVGDPRDGPPPAPLSEAAAATPGLHAPSCSTANPTSGDGGGAATAAPVASGAVPAAWSGAAGGAFLRFSGPDVLGEGTSTGLIARHGASSPPPPQGVDIAAGVDGRRDTPSSIVARTRDAYEGGGWLDPV